MLDEAVTLSTGLPGGVALRRLSAADADAFADHVVRDQERLDEHLPWPAVTNTPDGARQWLGAYERGEDGRVLVAGAWRDGSLLGGALLFHHEPAHGNVELGCWVAAVAEGAGVARAACRALIGIARSDLAAERIAWHATTTNPRSRRLAERLGFRHEGTLRSNYVLHGTRLDTDVFSLVGDEITQPGR